MQLKVLAILENTVIRHNLLALHGQSLLIEWNGKKHLFDVGEIYEGFKYNLDQMSLNLDEIESIFISHRHIDHIGALPELIPHLKDQKIYFPTQLGEPDLREFKEQYRFFPREITGGCNVAISGERLEQILKYSKTEVVTTEKMIDTDFYTTGSLGEKMQEQSLVFDFHDKGIVIVTGCSHPTLEVIIHKAKKITGNDKVYGIIGGFHFKEMDSEAVQKQIEFLKTLNLEFLLPSHCTGNAAIRQLVNEMGKMVITSSTGSYGVGNEITIDDEIELRFV